MKTGNGLDYRKLLFSSMAANLLLLGFIWTQHVRLREAEERIVPDLSLEFKLGVDPHPCYVTDLNHCAHPTLGKLAYWCTHQITSDCVQPTADLDGIDFSECRAKLVPVRIDGSDKARVSIVEQLNVLCPTRRAP